MIMKVLLLGKLHLDSPRETRVDLPRLGAVLNLRHYLRICTVCTFGYPRRIPRNP